jgi:hypothetical protein
MERVAGRQGFGSARGEPASRGATRALSTSLNEAEGEVMAGCLGRISQLAGDGGVRPTHTGPVAWHIVMNAPLAEDLAAD